MSKAAATHAGAAWHDCWGFKIYKSHIEHISSGLPLGIALK